MDREKSASIARKMVAGKVKNSHQVFLRGARESDLDEEREPLKKVAESQGIALFRLKDVNEIDQVRGAEGEAATVYFRVFDRMVKADPRETFAMKGCNRRPPLDPINGLLSFLYICKCI